ncbi:MAG TPA: hypothetical protein VNE39_11225 [Planctomycetota bacterium]|nr:hypothetical protein [Planctomycetota bacterium]
MSGPEPGGMGEIKVNAANLYREETFSDLRVATIRRLEPVKADGSPDPSREPLFFGQAQMMTQAGALPIEAPLEAATLEEAMAKFPDAIREAVGEVVEHMRELQRQAASRIVVPSTMPGGPGGKIQLG